jgi:hypothetical protein
MKLFRRHILTIIAMVTYWVLIFTLTHIPMSVPNLIFRLQASDKMLHFTAYMLLVFLIWFAINPNAKVNWKKASVWIILFVVIWYGVIDEWLQGYVGRTPDVRDFLADLSGTVTSLILLSIFSFWTASVVVGAAVIFIFTNFTKVNPGDLVSLPSCVFYLLSYGFLTVLWMRWMHYFASVKIPQPRWFVQALGLPLILLIFTDLFSLIVVGNVGRSSTILSAVGIVSIVLSTYLIVRFRQLSAGKLSSQRT